MGSLILPLGWTHWKIHLLKEGCYRFQDVHFSHVTVEGRIVNSNMNAFSSFPGNLFDILVYYFEVCDVGFEMIV